MSAKAIESGEGDATELSPLEYPSDGECSREAPEGGVAQGLGCLNEGRGGLLGSGLDLPPAALCPIRSLTSWASDSCSVKSGICQLCVGAGSRSLCLLLGFTSKHLCHLLAQLPLRSPPDVRVLGSFGRWSRAPCGASGPSAAHPAGSSPSSFFFFFPEEDEPSQSTDQASDGSPGKPPQGPPQGPDGSGSDPRDPPKAGGSNFAHYAGN